MAMCKECGNVVGVDNIENGICKTCIAGGAVAQTAVINPAVDEMLNVSNFGNPFSFKGRSGRLDYLVYGVLLASSLMALGFYIGIKLENIALLYGLVIVGGVMALATTVRRSRDREENIILVLILSAIPYFGFLVVLFLLLAPGKRDKKPVESKNDTTNILTSKKESE